MNANVKNKYSTIMKTEIKKILYKFLQDGISSDDAAQQVLDLFSVSNRDSKLPDLVLHVGRDGVIQVFDQDNNAVLYEGTEIECKDFISGFNGC